MNSNIKILSNTERALLISDRMAKLIKQPYLLTLSRHNLKKPEMRIMMKVMGALQLIMHDLQPCKEEYKKPTNHTIYRLQNGPPKYEQE